MKISIPQAGVAQASVQQVSVGEVRLGPVHVGQLSLNKVHLQTATGVAQMRNLSVVLTLKFSLDWKVGVVIDMPDPLPDVDFSDKGTMDLGTLTLGIGFGNLTLPGLADLSLDLASLAVPDLSVVVGALKGLKLGPALAERIVAQGFGAPRQGFGLDGLGLGGVEFRGVDVADAALAGATVGRISGGSLPLAGLSMPAITLPQVKVPRLSSQKLDVSSNKQVTTMPTVDIGLIASTLKVTTTAQVKMDELRIDGIKASASIGEIALKNVELPFEVLDLNLSQIGIEHVEVPKVEVS